MTTRAKCPNPQGCDGELYARADESGEEWCPQCGFVFRGGVAVKTSAKCPNPKGCDGELYARADASGEEWCPDCGYVFRRGASPSAGSSL